MISNPLTGFLFWATSALYTWAILHGWSSKVSQDKKQDEKQNLKTAQGRPVQLPVVSNEESTDALYFTYLVFNCRKISFEAGKKK